MDIRPNQGNTPLDPSEAEGLIPDLTTQVELNEFEFRNILQARQWLARNPKISADVLNPETLRRIHQQMFGQTWRWAGRYRLTQKSIGVEAFRISTELKNLVDDVTVWIQCDTYPKEEIAVRFHHRLVQIHPFPNGNGRHARLVTDLLCAQLGLPEFSWGRANLTDPGEVRQRYIAALGQADRHDLSPLIEFVRS